MHVIQYRLRKLNCALKKHANFIDDVMLIACLPPMWKFVGSSRDWVIYYKMVFTTSNLKTRQLGEIEKNGATPYLSITLEVCWSGTKRTSLSSHRL